MEGQAKQTLRDSVKECLLSVVTDTAASAAARASAGRTLLEYFDDGEHARGSGGKRGAELTLAELDAEIEREASHPLPMSRGDLR